MYGRSYKKKGGEIMNSKIIISVIVAAVVIGGGALLLTTNRQTAPVEKTVIQQPTVIASQSAQQPTSSPSASQAPENTVTESSDGFTPQTITVKAGTKVTWINKSGDVGNVSSANHPTHLTYPKLNLGDFADGETVSLVFDTAGAYKYHDHLNPNRFGTVVVE